MILEFIEIADVDCENFTARTAEHGDRIVRGCVSEKVQLSGEKLLLWARMVMMDAEF
jgi:hypothetical protein